MIKLSSEASHAFVKHYINAINQEQAASDKLLALAQSLQYWVASVLRAGGADIGTVTGGREGDKVEQAIQAAERILRMARVPVPDTLSIKPDSLTTEKGVRELIHDNGGAKAEPGFVLQAIKVWRELQSERGHLW